MKKIFITGGAGYCGSRLVPQLLDEGYEVTVFDLMIYGSDFFSKKNGKLKIIKGDIRDQTLLEQSSQNHDTFINLACISNDASFVLNEKLSTAVNLDAFEPMVTSAKKNGFKRFIYASSSSVYGVSEKKDVTEDHPLVPLTLYNKYKGMCEPILKKYTDDNFVGVIFRPATVCGYAPRQRLDVSVNILTNHAINKKKITVFGGDQLRPNLHIQDYCDLVKILIEAPKNKIQNEIFNVGYENMSIKNIALLVKKVVGEEFNELKNLEIHTEKSDDNRSYHINSDKVKKILNFQPKNNVEFAIRELCRAFKKGLLPNSFEDDIYFNVKRMKRLNIS